MTLSGCWDSLELRDSAMVSAIGIDVGKAHRYRYSIEVLRPAAESSKANSDHQGSVVLNRTGVSLADVANNYLRDTRRLLEFTHTRVIVLSENMARKGILPILDLWRREPMFRLNSYLFVTPDFPQEVLKAKPTLRETVSLDLVGGGSPTLMNGSSNTSYMDVYDFLRLLSEPSDTAYVPVIRVITHGGERFAEVERLALFKHGRMMSTLNDRETIGLIMMLGLAKHSTIQAFDSFNRTPISMFLENEKVKITPAFNTRPTKIQIELQGTLSEDSTGESFSIKRAKWVERMVSAKAKRDVQSALCTIQKSGIDAIRLGTQIYRNSPVLWTRLSSHWNNQFSRMHIQVQIICHIHSPGLIRSMDYASAKE